MVKKDTDTRDGSRDTSRGGHRAAFSAAAARQARPTVQPDHGKKSAPQRDDTLVTRAQEKYLKAKPEKSAAEHSLHVRLRRARDLTPRKR